MREDIKLHLRSVDPDLGRYVDQVGEVVLVKSSDYFISLCSSIIGQQLAGKAADAIYARFEALFPDKTPTPQALLKIPEQAIRDIGASWAKVRALKDLAQKVVNKEVVLDTLDSLDNQQVIETLVKVKGIGPWTAEMFLMFTLAREDIFSFGDLGLLRGIQKVYKLKKEPSRKTVERITKKWSPYRTYASRVLWKVLDLKI